MTGDGRMFSQRVRGVRSQTVWLKKHFKISHKWVREIYCLESISHCSEAGSNCTLKLITMRSNNVVNVGCAQLLLAS